MSKKYLAAIERALSTRLELLCFEPFERVEDVGGVSLHVFRKRIAAGIVGKVAFAAGKSANKHSFFLRNYLGISNESVIGLLNSLVDGWGCVASTPVGHFTWSLASYSTGGEFCPSLDTVGTDVFLSENPDELAVLCNKLDEAIERMTSIALHHPPYIFYNDFDRAGRGRTWVAMLAVMKYIAGEHFVGEQLLISALNTATGRAPPGSDFESPSYKIFGLRENPEEARFLREVLVACRRSKMDGNFARIRDAWREIASADDRRI